MLPLDPGPGAALEWIIVAGIISTALIAIYKVVIPSYRAIKSAVLAASEIADLLREFRELVPYVTKFFNKTLPDLLQRIERAEERREDHEERIQVLEHHHRRTTRREERVIIEETSSEEDPNGDDDITTSGS